MNVVIRPMNIQDYEKVAELWHTIPGFYIRSIDDSKEGVRRFLERNKNTSVVAELKAESKIIGSILCGHDGRYGAMYHVCVHKDYRKRGIGRSMVTFALEALKKENISTISLIAFSDNVEGNAFWNELGWEVKTNVNRYEIVLNRANIATKN